MTVHAVWNTLHDGTIEAMEGSGTGDLLVAVGIEYLCTKLPTSAKHLIVILRGCTQCIFHPFQGEPISEFQQIGSQGIEVLYASEKDGVVRIDCADGTLTLAYESCEIQLAEGKEISQSELEAAAESYWTEWSSKHAS